MLGIDAIRGPTPTEKGVPRIAVRDHSVKHDDAYLWISEDVTDDVSDTCVVVQDGSDPIAPSFTQDVFSLHEGRYDQYLTFRVKHDVLDFRHRQKHATFIAQTTSDRNNMSKIHLTIDKSYCANWGVYQGIRELIQNAKDAEEYDGKPMIITHYPRTNRLEIVSKGVFVQPANLLVLGKTSKGAGNQRGKFGEGFVLGVLALMRKECHVSFRNGDLSWTVSFEMPDTGHPLEGNELLTFKSRAIVNRENDFWVQIEGINAEAWNILRTKFLFLEPGDPAHRIETEHGALLMDAPRKGQVFVRGIYVRSFEDLSCGYDLPNVQLDRDRQMIDEWHLHYALGNLWTLAAKAGAEDVATKVYTMAKANAPDTRQIRYHADDKLLANMRRHFEKEHGDNAVPVVNNAEADVVTKKGGKATVVSAVLKELLEKSGLSIDAASRRLDSVVERRWTSEEVASDDTNAWYEMICLEKYLPSLLVVDFKGETPNIHLIEEDTVVGVDRRCLNWPSRQLLARAIEVEAKRLGIAPFDVLINRLAPEESSPLKSTGSGEAKISF